MTTGQADRGRQVELILRQVDQLPTLSPVASRLIELGAGDEVEVDEVAALIESDPALTARILRMCASADKGLGDRITGVRQAVVMLGLEAVRAAVLSVCVYELIESRGRELDAQLGAGAERAFDRAGLWRHAVAVACAARMIAERAPGRPVGPDEAFVAGLLHELGKMALELVLPKAYGRVVSLAERRGSDAAPIERSVLGLDHFAAGRRLAQRWGLPTPLVDVIWLHGQPEGAVPAGTAVELVGVVGAAKALCRELHIGWCGEFAPTPPAHPRCAALGLDVAAVDAIAAVLPAEVSERCERLGLEAGGGVELMLESLTRANRRLSAVNAELEARARASAAQARTLEQIDRLHADALESRGGLVDVLGAVVRSAAQVLGEGYFAVLCRCEPGGAWELHRYADSGEPTGVTALSSQVGRQISQSLRERGRRSAAAFGERTLGADLWAALAQECDTDRLRAIPLPGVEAVLLCEHDGAPGAVLGAWGAVVRAGAEREMLVRLGERLAEANRALGAAQARLSEREALARLGETTAGAAHEMNNPLTIIRGRAQLLASRLRDPEDRSSAASIASSAAELSELIASLHVLTEHREPVPVPVGVRALLGGVVERARARARGSARVVVEAGEDEVLTDRELLAGVVEELVVNAIESAGSDGAGANVRVAGAWTADEGADGRLVISVEDRGVGLSDRALRHAFDPFFSEKPAGRQRGLGLSKARRLAELMGGTVVLERRDGGGSAARVSVPAARAQDARGGPAGEGRAAA